MPEFLPISRADMQRRGWEQCDFVYIIGDGYVDHPSFGHAIISRVLEDAGYKVGIISQPDWKNPASINALGEPRLGFLVMGGNMDSMVNHYTVSKAHRKTDAYTPGGVMGKRPDYAVTVYCNLIRRSFPKIPILIGGIEAMPTSLLSPASTITTTLTTSMAVYAEGSAQDDVLWALGLLLMGMSLIFILIIHLIGRKGAKARG